MAKGPIKRIEELQGVSREHHHALLLSWKINQGIKKNVDTKRILSYIQWFREEHLKPHFEIEEKWIFPILGKEDPMVKRALEDHQHLMSMAHLEMDTHELEIFADDLKEHIRFEERELFQKAQNQATPEELRLIKEHHKEEDYCERTEDEFWL